MAMGKMHTVSGVFVVSLMLSGFIVTNRYITAASGASIQALPRPTPIEKSAFAEYRGIVIGMAADDLRKKLGPPKDKSDAQDFYSFSETESAQFYYDDSHHLTATMITYMGDLKNAPTPKTYLAKTLRPNPTAVFQRWSGISRPDIGSRTIAAAAATLS